MFIWVSIRVFEVQGSSIRIIMECLSHGLNVKPPRIVYSAGFFITVSPESIECLAASPGPNRREAVHRQHSRLFVRATVVVVLLVVVVVVVVGGGGGGGGVVGAGGRGGGTRIRMFKSKRSPGGAAQSSNTHIHMGTPLYGVPLVSLHLGLNR